jgi:hypothetical protein
MLPNSALAPVFFVLTVFPVVALSVAAARACCGWYGEAALEVQPGQFGQIWKAFKKAVPEVATQRKMGSCKEDRSRTRAHRAVVGGFAGLLAASSVVALLMASGRSYPLAMGNPLKVASKTLGYS